MRWPEAKRINRVIYIYIYIYIWPDGSGLRLGHRLGNTKKTCVFVFCFNCLCCCCLFLFVFLSCP